MLQSREPDINKQHPPKKLRSACDGCHQAKMKCSGGTPCAGCRDSGYDCSYSVSNRIGRPKGAKNKRTLDRTSRKRSETNDKTVTDQNSPTQTQTPLTVLGADIGNSVMPIDGTSVDSVLCNTLDASTFVTGSEPFGTFPDYLSSWYDFDSLVGAFPHAPQPSATGSYTSEEVEAYPRQDSAYVAPASLFYDRGIIDNVPNLNGLVGSMSGDEADEVRNNITSASSPSLASSTTCNCVQNHAELLCRLKELEQLYTLPRLDVMLSTAQQALVLWKNVIECHICQHDDNEEVLILSAMSICTVLRNVQNLCLQYYNSVVSGQQPISKQCAASGDIPDGMQSALSIYEISDEEGMALKVLLMSRTLDKVRYTLACSKVRLGTLSAKEKATVTSSLSRRPFPGHLHGDVDRLHVGGPGDLDRLLQVWRNLDSTVQMLERMLNSVPEPTTSLTSEAHHYRVDPPMSSDVATN